MKNDLEKRITEMETQDLQKMVNEDYGQYTGDALKIASEELKQRDSVSENGQNDETADQENITADDGSTAQELESNMISVILKVIGVLTIVIGIIAGLSLSNFYSVIIGLVSGFVFLGFGEIIRLLHEINERMK